MATYWEKLKDPRWQQKRLKVLEHANWTCKECGATDKTLHVHHGYYARSTDPWDYPWCTLHALCEDCHAKAQRVLEDVHFHTAMLSIKQLSDLLDLLQITDDFGSVNTPPVRSDDGALSR